MGIALGNRHPAHPFLACRIFRRDGSALRRGELREVAEMKPKSVEVCHFPSLPRVPLSICFALSPEDEHGLAAIVALDTGHTNWAISEVFGKTANGGTRPRGRLDRPVGYLAQV